MAVSGSLWSICVFFLPVVATQMMIDLTGNCSRTGPPEPLDIWGVDQRDPLTCSLFGTSSCQNGVLPPHLGGPFMGSPESLMVEGAYVKGRTGSLNPQLVFTWKPPVAAAGFNHLKGFYVEIHRLTGISTLKPFYCRVFDFAENNFTSKDYTLVFRKKMIGFPSGVDFLYHMKIFTLPMAAESKPKTAFFKLQPFLENGKATSADWSTSISYESDNLTAPARITVQFSLAPKEYNFKKYNIELVSDRDPKNVMFLCIISTLDSYSCQERNYQKPSEDAVTITHTFYDLPPAIYKVWVSPHNPHWQEEGQCLCSEKTSVNESHCVRCITTTTGNITVAQNGQQNGQLTVSGPSRTSTDLLTVLVAVLGAMVGLVLIVFVVIFYRKKRLTGNGLISDDKPANINNLKGGNTPSVLPRKKVYLLYAEDHKDHMNVITSFAFYLKDQCFCDVFYLPWFKGAFQSMGTYQWIMSHIDEADYVIVISSEAAFKLLDARNTNTSLRTEDEGPEGDVFSPAITHVRTKSREPDFYKKTILAYFDYTSEDFVLKEVSPGVYYKLPKHFKGLLCHIHEVDVFDLTHRQPNIDAMENLQATRSGQSFQEAMTKARHFQKSDPLWFDKRFYRQDSAYESDPDGHFDSVSLTPSPGIMVRDPMIDTRHLSAGTHTDSVVTYNTEYIREHEDINMIPPSEVPTDTPTEVVSKQLENINNNNISYSHPGNATQYEFYPQDMFAPSEIQTDVDLDRCFLAINMRECTEPVEQGKLNIPPDNPIVYDDLASGIDV
ncbi:interleukin cytokine receptor-related protein 1-like isoform X2 [Haliotis cracherodii]|uniref:interleukin cytokine receptor-related protein 1-like isoform X2 n=1 Tax=Haliotis cracherodii TaxID=6455 RepID=UPI0039E82E61